MADRRRAPAVPGPAPLGLRPPGVGGGRIFPDFRLVVTRPAAGELRAFTAICTHEQCLLTTVADGLIGCPCHGSRFAITDGAVVHGPAARSLTPRPVRLQGDSIILDS